MSVSEEQSILRIDSDRLLRRLEELSKIGQTEHGGVTRPGLSEVDRAGRDLIAEAAREDGLVSNVDEAGNLIIRPAHDQGAGPHLVMGSHLDTVINGGRLDGAYGVIAAVEVLRVLAQRSVRSPLTPIVVAFANEEGAAFPVPFWGAKALTGQIDRSVLATHDSSGKKMGQALKEFGGSPDRIEAAAWPAGSIGAYVELHVEQGPVLERAGTRIGVVSRIVGRTVIDIEIQAQAAHAGTTPMNGRRDALVAAAQMVLSVERLARERSLCRVATVGRLDVEPNATNVVPGKATLTAEIRDTEPDRLRLAEEALLAEVDAIAQRLGVQIATEVVMRVPPVVTDTRLRHAIHSAAAELGVSAVDLPSGAGHDAQIIAAVAPAAMIFVPSRNGVSHVPEEYTAPHDLVTGAHVLLHTALSLISDTTTHQDGA